MTTREKPKRSEDLYVARTDLGPLLAVALKGAHQSQDIRLQSELLHILAPFAGLPSLKEVLPLDDRLKSQREPA
jgi:hypothetical protein